MSETVNKKDSPTMLPIREVAERTGLSYYSLRKGCLTGTIIHVRCGNRFYINLDRLIDTLNGEDER